jgi:hypothetical protein
VYHPARVFLLNTTPIFKLVLTKSKLWSLFASSIGHLGSFFKALHGKTWIGILKTAQYEIHGLLQLNTTDPLTAYLQELQEFEAYLLNPTDPLPEGYRTVVRNMADRDQ